MSYDALYDLIALVPTRDVTRLSEQLKFFLPLSKGERVTLIAAYIQELQRQYYTDGDSLESLRDALLDQDVLERKLHLRIEELESIIRTQAAKIEYLEEYIEELEGVFESNRVQTLDMRRAIVHGDTEIDRLQGKLCDLEQEISELRRIRNSLREKVIVQEDVISSLVSKVGD